MGAVVLMGGDEFGQNCIPMDEPILRHVSHKPPRVLIVPTAASHENPIQAAGNGVRYFQALGAESTAAMVVDRNSADEPALAKLFDSADMVYLTGGNPWYLLEYLQGTLAWAAIEGVWRRGGMVAGSSAGAMVLGQSIRMQIGDRWMPAIGLVPNVVVLPHHEASTTSKLEPLWPGLAPGTALLGIDTATACANYGDGTWHVIGAGTAAVYLRDGAIHRHLAGESFRLDA